jgi:thioredoxin-related protein
VKKLRIILFIVLVFCIKAGAQGINFETRLSWAEIKSKAKTEEKYIFLDIYATWCGPCKIMDVNVFNKKTVGDIINSKFIAVKVQTDSTEIDNENVKNWRANAAKIKNEYQIRAYPTYIILASNGQLVHMITGAMPESVFLTEIERALNPEEQYNNLSSRYQGGERDPEFIRYLSKKAFEVGDKLLARKIAVNYINSLTEQDLYKTENIWFIYNNTKTSDDRGFSFFLNNVEKITKIDSSMKWNYCKGLTAKIIIEEEVAPYFRDCGGKPDWQIVRDKLVSKYGNAGEEIWKMNRDGWIFKYEIIPFLKSNPSVARIKDEFDKRKLYVTESTLYGNTVLYYLNASDKPNADLKVICDRIVYCWDVFVERCPDKISAKTLNQQAWFIFEESDDKKHLSSALSWAKKAVELASPLDMDWRTKIMDTYANLLYKLGRTKEAIEWEEKVVKLLPGPHVFTITLEKMRAGKVTWNVKKESL